MKNRKKNINEKNNHLMPQDLDRKFSILRKLTREHRKEKFHSILQLIPCIGNQIINYF